MHNLSFSGFSEPMLLLVKPYMDPHVTMQESWVWMKHNFKRLCWLLIAQFVFLDFEKILDFVLTPFIFGWVVKFWSFQDFLGSLWGFGALSSGQYRRRLNGSPSACWDTTWWHPCDAQIGNAKVKQAFLSWGPLLYNKGHDSNTVEVRGFCKIIA